ncbi:uncharacterized protein C1orf131-like [Liolophura sinensis]|uniref:uncharacterized protein C1orf131-like n=1 Tax=Liolophura sinensis TaxID=3198878 RepID=UPI00315884E4
MADLAVEKSSEESLNSTSILERLQQYGESWLDDDEYQEFVRKKQSRSKTSQQSSHHRYAGEQNGATKTEKVFSRRQKKKLKQKVNVISEGSAAENSDDILEKKFPVKRKRKNKHLEELQSELELNRNLSKTKEIRKGVTMNQRLSHADVIKPVGSDGKIFVFEDPAKRKQKKKLVISPVLEEPSSLTPEVPAQPEVNLHQARHDVKMFGITGFQGQQKETAVTDMLIKLGAKPPKRSFCSIKEFMETKQKIGTPAMNQKGGVNNLKGNKRR